MNSSPPGSTVYGIFQASTGVGLAFPPPGIFLTRGSNLSLCITGGFFTIRSTELYKDINNIMESLHTLEKVIP